MAKTVFGMPAKGADTQDTGKGLTPTKSTAAKSDATPMATPMAKPISTGPAPQKKPGAAAKTMFGMPAMKLPVTPGKATPQKPPAEPQSAAAETPPGDDAYKATMMGMPISEDALENAAPQGATEVQKAVQDTAPSEAVDAVDAVEDTSRDMSGNTPTSLPAAPAGKNKTALWVILGAGVFLVLCMVLYFFVFAQSPAPVPQIPQQPGVQTPVIPVPPGPAPATPTVTQ